MLRLKKDQVPDDENLKINLRVDSNPLNQDSDYIWMSYNEWIAQSLPWKEITDANIKTQIEKMIPEWSRKALSYIDDRNYWPVKFASVEFYIPEGKYVIKPYDLPGNVDDYMFERVSHDIEKSLLDMGAMYTNYTGMLD